MQVNFGHLIEVDVYFANRNIAETNAKLSTYPKRRPQHCEHLQKLAKHIEDAKVTKFIAFSP